MHNRTLVGAFGLLLSFAVAPPVLAQGAQVDGPAEGAEFVVIDTRRVVAESEIGRGITERAEAAARSWEERVTTARQELAALTQQRSQQSLTLTATALAALDAQIEQKNIGLQRLEEDARRELANLNQALMVELNEALGPPLEAYARERGFSFVFDSATAGQAGLLYWAPEADATDEFVSRLNGAVVHWQDTRDHEGRVVGSVRAPDTGWLPKAAPPSQPWLPGR